VIGISAGLIVCAVVTGALFALAIGYAYLGSKHPKTPRHSQKIPAAVIREAIQAQTTLEKPMHVIVNVRWPINY